MSRVEPAPFQSGATTMMAHQDKEMQQPVTKSPLSDTWSAHLQQTNFATATSGVEQTPIPPDFYQRLFAYIESAPGQADGLYTNAHPTHMMLQLHDYHTNMISLCELHPTSPTTSGSRARWQEFHHPSVLGVSDQDHHISQCGNTRPKAEVLEGRKEAYCVEHENAGFPYTGDVELTAFTRVMKGLPRQEMKAERAFEASQRWRVQYEHGGGMEEDWKMVRRWEGAEERKRETEKGKQVESSVVVQSSRNLSYTGQEFVPQSVPKTMQEAVSETVPKLKLGFRARV